MVCTTKALGPAHPSRRGFPKTILEDSPGAPGESASDLDFLAGELVLEEPLKKSFGESGTPQEVFFEPLKKFFGNLEPLKKFFWNPSRSCFSYPSKYFLLEPLKKFFWNPSRKLAVSPWLTFETPKRVEGEVLTL